MITEDYCSYEVAKLLKEKGFEGDINAYYHIWDNGNKVCSVQEFSRSEAPHLYIPVPTHQTAMKWLRIVHKIDVWVEGWNRRYKGYIHSEQRGEEALFYEDSYEVACEAALKYALENLI